MDLKTWRRQRRPDCKYSSHCFLAAVLAASDLSGRHGVSSHITHRMMPLMPPAAINIMQDAMDQTSWKLSTVRASLVLILDVAIMLWRRQHLTAPTQHASFTLRYSFADSSPQGIRDWLVHVVRSVHTSQFVPVCSVMTELSRTTGAVDSDVEFDEDISQSDGEAEAGPVLRDSSNHTQRAKLFATVVGAIKSHKWSTSCHRVRQRLF